MEWAILLFKIVAVTTVFMTACDITAEMFKRWEKDDDIR